MAIIKCSECGKEVSNMAKSCPNCGAPISQYTSNTERKIVFDGEIHKCPHCGEVLKAFETVCPTCKFELRGANASNAVKDMAEKLEKATSEKQRILIVKNFPIPNTKEDIFEFMLLASSNFNASYYASHLHEEDISDAWLIKIEQCYQKAKLTFTDKSDLENIKKIYDKIISAKEQSKKAKAIMLQKEAEAKKNKGIKITMLVLSCVLITIILICVMWSSCSKTNADKISVGISFVSVQGKYYFDVVELFEEKGFTNIEFRDDGWNLFHKSDTVKKVLIDGKEVFFSFTKVPKNAKILILYYG